MLRILSAASLVSLLGLLPNSQAVEAKAKNAGSEVADCFVLLQGNLFSVKRTLRAKHHAATCIPEISEKKTPEKTSWGTPLRFRADNSSTDVPMVDAQKRPRVRRLSIDETLRNFIGEPEKVLDTPELMMNLMSHWRGLLQMPQKAFPSSKRVKCRKTANRLDFDITLPRAWVRMYATGVRVATSSVMKKSPGEEEAEMMFEGYKWRGRFAFLNVPKSSSGFILQSAESRYESYLCAKDSAITELVNTIKKKKKPDMGSVHQARIEMMMLDNCFSQKQFHRYVEYLQQNRQKDKLEGVRGAWARLRAACAYFKEKPCRASREFAKRLKPLKSDASSGNGTVWKFQFERIAKTDGILIRIVAVDNRTKAVLYVGKNSPPESVRKKLSDGGHEKKTTDSQVIPLKSKRPTPSRNVPNH